MTFAKLPKQIHFMHNKSIVKSQMRSLDLFVILASLVILVVLKVFYKLDTKYIPRFVEETYCDESPAM